MNWIPIEGRSMRPFLNAGEQVAVDWLDSPVTPRVGEVLIAREAGEGASWIVHRVVPGPGGLQRLKGDASYVFDSLRPELAWGRVVAVKSAATARELPVRLSALDRWIAWCSARELRKLVFALGKIRRLGREWG